ncbi:MAG: polyphosphate kinase 1, partial [Aeromonas sp.]
HPRVLVFHNQGAPQVYLSSADWMSRNIDGRIEVAAPVYDESLKAQILAILNLQWSDNSKARILDSEQQNSYVRRGNKRKIRSQYAIYDYLTACESSDGY